MQEYEDLANMRKLNMSDEEFLINHFFFFIPHHGIMQHGKIRVVFNGPSRALNGISLNDTLHSGPTLQTDIIFILMRWRCFKYAFKTDIQKMYRQILIHPDDRKFQCIIWGDNAENYSAYELSTVTYGLGPSAYQAIACLHQLSDLESENHKSFYQNW